MASQETTPKGEAAERKQARPKRWSGLQSRMTVSYTLTMFVTVLLVEVLLGIVLFTLLLYGPLADDDFTRSARQTAGLYALEAANQAGGDVLDPQTTFEPGRPSSIALAGEYSINNPAYATYIPAHSSPSQLVTFALLIAPNGRVLASSYPARYPASTSVAQLLPNQAHLVTTALSGRSAITVGVAMQTHTVYAVEPVRSRDGHIIGAIYLQVPELNIGGLLQGISLFLLVSGAFWLLVTLPVGGLFGWLTTRFLIRRLRNLITATTRFADGDYTQRVQVSRPDEVGHLEEQFNRMAFQLVESITQRQALAEQNARLAERSRLARDLHDSVKQQAFAVSMQIAAALSLFDQKPEATRQHLQEADTLIYNVQRELTTLIQELRPLALQDKGLAAALREYVTSWGRQHNTAAEMQIADIGNLPLLTEEALLRVAQEALSNVARHSQASAVQVTLECKQEQVILTISDNGRGFDVARSTGSGVGLHSMQERMQALGGTATIESQPDHGTRLVARCPLGVKITQGMDV